MGGAAFYLFGILGRSDKGGLLIDVMARLPFAIPLVEPDLGSKGSGFCQANVLAHSFQAQRPRPSWNAWHERRPLNLRIGQPQGEPRNMDRGSGRPAHVRNFGDAGGRLSRAVASS